MPRAINSFDPSLTPQSGVIDTNLRGSGKLLLHNMSPFMLVLVDTLGNQYYSLPWESRVIPICAGNGQLTWEVATVPVITSGTTPTSIVTGESYQKSETIDGTYPNTGALLTNIGSQVTAGINGDVNIGNPSIPVTGVGGGSVAVGGTLDGITNPVGVTLESVVSIVQDAGAWFLVGQSNAALGPGGTASLAAPMALSTNVYALDFAWCSFPATSVADDLSYYLSMNNYKIVNGFSLTSGRVVVAQTLGGLVAPYNTSLYVSIHNASGVDTYYTIEFGFIGRVVTP